MMYQERLLKIIRIPHISEKTSVQLDKLNTVVFRVLRYATKIDVKDAVCVLFNVKVHKVNIVMVSGKIKGSLNKKGYCCDWKKAYVTLKKGYKIDLSNKIYNK